MEILFLVLPLALIVSTGAVFLFVWAARDGQFDDLETPGMRILHDDRPLHPLSSPQPPESKP